MDFHIHRSNVDADVLVDTSRTTAVIVPRRLIERVVDPIGEVVWNGGIARATGLRPNLRPMGREFAQRLGCDPTAEGGFGSFES